MTGKSFIKINVSLALGGEEKSIFLLLKAE
jgi:hypothetical protein